MASLDRFKQAQEQPYGGFGDAFREIAAGRKQSHWIWYILPQLAGLARSETAQHYGIAGVEEARAFLADPLLRTRLLTIARAAARHLTARPPRSVAELMGSNIDALKLVSSMTLFGPVARSMAAEPDFAGAQELAELAEAILSAAEAQGYGRCEFTQAALREAGPAPSAGSAASP
jgi:uncharacterized protein (DUF1810 family)